MATRKGKPLLHRDDWADAALRALAEGGVGAVTIQSLAKRLGATRGSFYWHFADRADLIEAALQRWEQTGTTEIVAALDRIADPRDQLQYLFTASFANLEEGDIEAALAAHASDPLVAPVLERVAVARLDVLRRLFRRLGFDLAAADARAHMTFAVYMGHFQMRRAMAASGREPSTAYIQELLVLLTEQRGRRPT